MEPVTTAEELLRRSGELGICELVRGKWRALPYASVEHGAAVISILCSMGGFVRQNRLGRVWSSKVGFFIEHDPGAGADVAFVRHERISWERSAEYFPGAPDLAVEVFSPGDSQREVLAKIQMWLATGAKTVWLADTKL